MSAQTLTDFLLARIAEDERDLDLIGEKRHDWHARWLAECEAKRELAKRHRPTDERNRWCAYCAGTDNAEYPCETSRLLALPYADHPDYRDEWRP